MPASGWPVAAAAERVGVSVSTLRSWEARYGLAPHGRTRGGHRRYTAADIARLQRLYQLVRQGVPTGAAALTVQTRRPEQKFRVATGSDIPAIERLRAATDTLHLASVERLARRLLSAQGTVVAWSQTLTPLLEQLGNSWAANGTGVECEHLATEAIQAALISHTRRQRASGTGSSGNVLLAAAPEEAHTLPLHALAAALAEHGIPSSVFGALPAEALRSAAEHSRPSAVVVFARSRQTADVRTLRRVIDTAPLICAGGPGWSQRVPVRAAVVRDLASALDLLRVTVGDAPAGVNGS